MTLFDDTVRTDPSPRTATEDTFAFLNRVETPFWCEVRRVLEEWFARFPADHADELRKRFRSRHPGHHRSAWWELYLHELCVCLGYDVTVHPELPDSAKHPDFELRRGDSRLYLEAAVVFSGIVSDDHDAPGWLQDAINRVDNGNFFVNLKSVDSAGAERLKNREIAAPLQQWLDALDPDDVTRQYEQAEVLPSYHLSCRGWDVAFEAIPVKPEARGRPDHRVLGMGLMQGGVVNDVEQLKSTLKSKTGQFGQPDVPAVIAVLCESSFMETLDIEQALFGSEAFQLPWGGGGEPRLIRQRNGLWTRRDGPQNQRVSAVMTAVGLHHANAADVIPHLWINPWANRPLNEGWPFPSATASDRGEISYSGAQPDMRGLLGVGTDWPGAEPFPRETSRQEPQSEDARVPVPTGHGH